MATFVYGLNVSLDGIVDHDAFAPGAALFRHFIEETRGLAGSVYGRIMYKTMRYWDEDQPDWGDDEREYAAAWRRQPKFVVSRTLASVGPNATLIRDDLEPTLRDLKAGREGEFEVAGPMLANHLAGLGLIDEFRLYLHPLAVGHGKSYFAHARRELRLAATARMPGDVLRLSYVPLRPA